MSRRLLTILAIAGGIVALLLVAVAVVVATLDVNALLAPLAARVKEAAGRDLAVRGGAVLSVSLEPRVRLSDVTFSNVAGASPPAMLTARQVEVQVALLPLLRRRVEVVRFTLIEPTIALSTDAAGRGNWEFGPSAPVPGTPSGADASGAALALGVGEFAVDRGTIEYRDGRSGEVTRIEVDRLFLRARDPGAAVVAQFAGRVQGVPVTLEGTAGPLDALLRKRFPIPVAMKGDIAGRKLDVQAKVSAPPDRLDLGELDAAFGESRLQGSLGRAKTGGRPAWTFALHSPQLRLEDVALAVPGKPPGTPVAVAAPAGTLFAPRTFSFAFLRDANARGTLAVDRLVLTPQRVITGLATTVALADGRLALAPLAGSIHGGRIEGRLAIDASAAEPKLDVALKGHGFQLASLLAAFGLPGEGVQGGASEFAADIRARGAGPRAWAATSNGSLLLTVGPAVLPRTDRLDPTLARALNAVNPFRARDEKTDLVCAVVRLPLVDGRARIDRSIAAETSKVGVSASGTIDLTNETLDLSVHPDIRDELPVDLAQFAGLVHLQGPIAHPTVGIDPAGVAGIVARIGAAAGTGGLSLLGEALVRGGARMAGVGRGGNECAVALGKTVAPAAPEKAPRGPAPPDAGSPLRELERAFRGIGKR